jgi:hypothetical protein
LTIRLAPPPGTAVAPLGPAPTPLGAVVAVAPAGPPLGVAVAPPPLMGIGEPPLGTAVGVAVAGAPEAFAVAVAAMAVLVKTADGVKTDVAVPLLVLPPPPPPLEDGVLVGVGVLVAVAVPAATAVAVPAAAEVAVPAAAAVAVLAAAEVAVLFGVGVAVDTGPEQVALVVAEATMISAPIGNPKAAVVTCTCSAFTVRPLVVVPLPERICSLTRTKPTPGTVTSTLAPVIDCRTPLMRRLVSRVPAGELDAVVPFEVLVATDLTASAVIAPPSRLTLWTVELLVADACVAVDVSVLVSVSVPEWAITPAGPAEMLAAVLVPPGGKVWSATLLRVIGEFTIWAP